MIGRLLRGEVGGGGRGGGGGGVEEVTENAQSVDLGKDRGEGLVPHTSSSSSREGIESEGEGAATEVGGPDLQSQSQPHGSGSGFQKNDTLGSTPPSSSSAVIAQPQQQPQPQPPRYTHRVPAATPQHVSIPPSTIPSPLTPTAPPQPLYILRGHKAQINAIHFLRKNSRLITCDAEGWVIVWKVSSRRPVAVWKAHDAAVLAVGEWGDDRIITHGRDNKLYVWKLGPADEAGLTTQFPIPSAEIGPGKAAAVPHRQPWLLHSIHTNALNFCGFSMCSEKKNAEPGNLVGAPESVLIAVPSALDSDSLPSGERVYSGINMATALPLKHQHDEEEEEEDVVNSKPGGVVKSGMAMSLTLLHHPIIRDTLLLAVGYESGHVVVYSRDTSSSLPRKKNQTGKWQVVYAHQTHSQPVLSVAVFELPVPSSQSSRIGTRKNSRITLLSTSADPLIAIHPLVEEGEGGEDGSRSGKPVCVLNTHRTGQQDVKVRGDGRGLFVTAGWDGRGRVYAASASATEGGAEGVRDKIKIKEVAVLKWQDATTGDKEKEVGCYAVGFGEVLGEGGGGDEGNGGGVVVEGRGRGGGGGVVERRREERETRRHWVAAGGRDGRVSLWEIF
ncbi:WD40-repeat-containing domain protein [Peziza echinospora]|nr:WD40-repeat-containing domain protein [Peziza echinospora]